MDWSIDHVTVGLKGEAKVINGQSKAILKGFKATKAVNKGGCITGASKEKTR